MLPEEAIVVYPPMANATIRLALSSLQPSLTNQNGVAVVSVTEGGQGDGVCTPMFFFVFVVALSSRLRRATRWRLLAEAIVLWSLMAGAPIKLALSSSHPRLTIIDGIVAQNVAAVG